MGVYTKDDIRLLRRVCNSAFGAKNYRILEEEKVEGISLIKIKTSEGFFYGIILEDEKKNKIALIIREKDKEEFAKKVRKLIF